MNLTPEQEIKLVELEKELLQKKIYDEKNHHRLLEVSKQTGIPYSLVDSDVVKIGSMLGLIRSRRDDDDAKGDNLMDILFGCDDKPTRLDYSNVPPYFTFSRSKVTEQEKLDYHKETVKHACNTYYTFINKVLQNECKSLDKYITFSNNQPSTDEFTETVKESMEAVFEMLLEEEDDDLWEQLKVTRNSLLCVISLCDYKRIVSLQVSALLTKYTIDIIFNNMSYIDAKLTLFPNCEDCEDKTQLSKLLNAIVVRSYTKDPELKAFSMECVTKECLTPIYMFLPIERVFHYFIMGPYNNNAIGYLKPNYYILKSINSGIRMWIMDDMLSMFSEEIRTRTLNYCEKLYKTLNASSLDVTILSQNIKFLSSSQNFRSHICKIVSTNSLIIPTEADVFDEQPV